MKRLITALAAVAVLLLTCDAWAAELLNKGSCDPADAKSCVQPLMKGEKAPWSGQLLTYRRVGRCAVGKMQIEERVQAELDLQLRPLEIDRGKYKALWESGKLATVEMKDVYDAQLEEAYHWSRAPWFVTMVSVGVTVGLFIGAVKTVQALE